MKNTDISESNLRTKWLGIYKPYPQKNFFFKDFKHFYLGHLMGKDDKDGTHLCFRSF